MFVQQLLYIHKYKKILEIYDSHRITLKQTRSKRNKKHSKNLRTRRQNTFYSKNAKTKRPNKKRRTIATLK